MLGQLFKKPALEVVARLAMQHARLGVAQVQALSGAGNGDVHQAALFFQPFSVAQGVFMGEQALLHPGDEDTVKLQPFGRVHRHQLHSVLPGLRHVVARLQGRMGQEGHQGRQHFAGFSKGVIDLIAQSRIITDTREALACRALLQGRRSNLNQGGSIAPKAFECDKALSSIHQLFQVFDPILTFTVSAVMLQKSAVVKHKLNDGAQVHIDRLLTHHIHLGHKARNSSPRPARQGTDRIMQGTPASPRQVLQLLNTAGTDTPRREVDDPHKTGVVIGVLKKPQIRQGVFDFGPLKKAQPTIDAIRHSGIEQRRLDHPALRVRAIEHRNFFSGGVFAHQLLHFVHHPLGFGKVTTSFKHAHRFSRPLIGTQIFTKAFAVVADQRIGGVQDVAVTAVVLLQLDLVLHTKLAHKVRHVADARSAKSVNALIVITYRQNSAAGTIGAGIRPLAGQHLDPGVLQFVRVLKLINQDMAKAPLVMLPNRIVVTQQFVGPQHQFTKIDHALALALFFV